MKIKKNMFSFVLMICLMVPVLALLSACGGDPFASATSLSPYSDGWQSEMTTAEKNKTYYFTWENDFSSNLDIVIEDAEGNSLLSGCTVKLFNKDKTQLELTQNGDYMSSTESAVDGDVYYISVKFSSSQTFILYV